MGRFWSRAKQRVKARAAQNNFTDGNRDKAFGFLLGYNYFHLFRNALRQIEPALFLRDTLQNAANCVIDSSTRATRQKSTLQKL